MAKKKKCSFCGVEESGVSVMFSGPDGSNICNNCIENAYHLLRENGLTPLDGLENISKEDIDLKRIPRPQEIKSYLDQYVIGQEDAKRYLSVSVYNIINVWHRRIWTLSTMVWRSRSLTLLW